MANFGFLTCHHLKADDFARFAFGDDFKRAAADFAIGREPLAGDAGVNGQLERLAAEWTRNGFVDDHVKIYPRQDEVQ